ncbi:hypothetical protein IMZ48_01260, partial [Candidatus Bathyarchaeota archaeon]|nr:hypothetical protein [Candidatus Bathyarchaeota archaeon]
MSLSTVFADPLTHVSRGGSPSRTAPRLHNANLPWSAAWIASYEGEESGDEHAPLNPPPRLHQPQHNSTPSDTQRRVSKDGFVSWADPSLPEVNSKKPK